MQKLEYLTTIKMLSLAVLIAVLSPGMGNSLAWSLDHANIRKAHTFRDSQSALTALRNLKWLRYLTAEDDSSSGGEVPGAPSENSAKGTITSTIETTYAVIYSYEGAKIPSYLIANFDRIFRIIANYFNLEMEEKKVVVWVMDYDTLQKSYPGQKNYPGGSPDTVAALYAPSFNYFFFTPRYMNDYYVAHELIHHFIDEHPEEVAAGLPQVITQHNAMGFPLQHFLRRHEERIVLELAQIIIYQNLAKFALRGV